MLLDVGIGLAVFSLEPYDRAGSSVTETSRNEVFMQSLKRKLIVATVAAPVLAVSIYGARACAKSVTDLDLLAPGAKMSNPDSFTPPAITNSNNNDSQNVTVQPLPVSNAPQINQQINNDQQKNSEQEALDPIGNNSPHLTLQADQQIQNATDRQNEMALNNDVESLEQFGDAAAAKSAEHETDRLAHEDSHLRYEAIVLKRRTNLMAARYRWLLKIYKKRLIQVVLARKNVQLASRRLRFENQKFDHLHAQVNFRNNLLARDREQVARFDRMAYHDRLLERDALHRIALMNRWNNDMKMHIARLQRYLRWKYKHYEYLRSRELKLSREHYRLAHKLAHEQYEVRRINVETQHLAER